MPLVLAAAMVAALLPAATASAATSPNPWLNRGFLNIAHQGGENEAPSSTMYAFRSAIADRGADMLELDVHLTSDGHLVVLHNDSVDSTTDGSGEIRNMALAQIQALDAGYWFVPQLGANHGHPAGDYPFRAVRTGATKPPTGYSADDFRIPTLNQVLDAFPDTPINIEIKVPDDDPDLSIPIADALAELLNSAPYASRDDIIVVSFAQEPMVEFHSLAPDVWLAPSQDALVNFALADQPLMPDGVALQVPPLYGGIDVPDFLINTKHVQEAGYAVHIWTDGDQDETPESYERLIGFGVDGIMSAYPGRLADYLCTADVVRPDGSARCAVQEPRPTLTLAAHSLGAALRRGVTTRLDCARSCHVFLKLRLASPLARKLGMKRATGDTVVVSSSELEVEPGGRSLLQNVRLSARKALSKLRRATLHGTAKATADNGVTSAPADFRLKIGPG